MAPCWAPLVPVTPAAPATALDAPAAAAPGVRATGAVAGGCRHIDARHVHRSRQQWASRSMPRPLRRSRRMSREDACLVGRRVVGLDEGGEAVQEAGKRGAQHAACLDVRQKVRLRWLGRCTRAIIASGSDARYDATRHGGVVSGAPSAASSARRTSASPSAVAALRIPCASRTRPVCTSSQPTSTARARSSLASDVMCAGSGRAELGRSGWASMRLSIVTCSAPAADDGNGSRPRRRSEAASAPATAPASRLESRESREIESGSIWLHLPSLRSASRSAVSGATPCSALGAATWSAVLSGAPCTNPPPPAPPAGSPLRSCSLARSRKKRRGLVRARRQRCRERRSADDGAKDATSPDVTATTPDASATSVPMTAPASAAPDESCASTTGGLGSFECSALEVLGFGSFECSASERMSASSTSSSSSPPCPTTADPTTADPTAAAPTVAAPTAATDGLCTGDFGPKLGSSRSPLVMTKLGSSRSPLVMTKLGSNRSPLVMRQMVHSLPGRMRGLRGQCDDEPAYSSTRPVPAATALRASVSSSRAAAPTSCTPEATPEAAPEAAPATAPAEDEERSAQRSITPASSSAATR
eukprot:jgi/Chrpa1/16097/Chrysochromulina_OHIO_Genome00018127-RA